MLKSLLTKSKALFSVGAIAVIATIAIAAVVLVNGRDQDGNWGSLWGEAEDVTVAELPPEAQQKLKLIKAGGPFPYKDDGIRYRNGNKKLPIKRKGYYRVYIVPTPGVKGLGKRRIVVGAGRDNNYATSGEYWYTSDDYEILHRIREK